MSQNKYMNNNLIAGFEFEFGVNSNSFENKNDNNFPFTPTENAFFMFVDMLLKKHPETDWEYLLTLTNDFSIDIPGYTTVEAVSRPLPIDIALDMYHKIMSLLQDEPFATNNTCSLHLNISFEDKPFENENEEVEYYQNLAYLLNNQKELCEIKSWFNRDNSEYCEEGLLREVAQNRIFQSMGNYFYKLAKSSDNNKINIHDLIKDIENKNLNNNLQLLLSEALKQSLFDSWESVRPAIVMRQNKKTDKKCYIEFRSIGGEYSKKKKLVDKALRMMLINFMNLEVIAEKKEKITHRLKI